MLTHQIHTVEFAQLVYNCIFAQEITNSEGKVKHAIDYFDTAFMVLNESKEANNSRILVGFYINYALIKTLTGQMKEANDSFEKAEKNISDEFGESNINIIHTKEAQVGYAESQLLKYKQTQKTPLLYKADTIFRQVLNELDNISNSIGNNDKLLLVEMKNPVFNLAIESSNALLRSCKKISRLE